MQQETVTHQAFEQAHNPPILTLARRLEVLYQDTEGLDSLDWGLEVCALEDEITANPATSMNEAAIQIMLASAYIERLREDLVDDTDVLLGKLQRLIRSALAAFVRETGMDLAEFGGKRYLPSHLDALSHGALRN